MLVIVGGIIACALSAGGLYWIRFFRPGSVVGPIRYRSVHPVALAGVGFVAYSLWGAVTFAAAAFLKARWPNNAVATIVATVVGLVVASVVLTGLLQLLVSATAGKQEVASSDLTADQRGRELGWSIKAGLLGLALVFPWVFGVSEVTAEIIRRMEINIPTSHELLQAIQRNPSAGVVAAVAISAVVVGPIFEELLFRAVVQTALGNTLRIIVASHQGREAAIRWTAILGTSVLFAMLHSPYSWPAIFVLSVGLGYVYERRGHLVAPILMHSLFNGINVLLAFLGLGSGQ